MTVLPHGLSDTAVLYIFHSFKTSFVFSETDVLQATAKSNCTVKCQTVWKCLINKSSDTMEADFCELLGSFLC